MTDYEHFESVALDVLQDADAARFVGLVCGAAHAFDDLADRDKPVSTAEVLRAFRALAVQLPANPFYRAHFEQLHPLLDVFILSWSTANDFEAGDDEEMLRIAYVIRSDYMNLVMKAASILRGFEYAREVAPRLRALIHAERWDGYLKALEAQREAQGA